MERLSIIAALLKYLWTNKRYWLIPVIIVFLLMGILILISESSAVGAFIYTLF